MGDGGNPGGRNQMFWLAALETYFVKVRIMSFGIYCAAPALRNGMIVKVADKPHYVVERVLSSMLEDMPYKVSRIEGLRLGYGDRLYDASSFLGVTCKNLSGWRIDQSENAAKPSKLIRKFMYELRKQLENEAVRPLNESCMGWYNYFNNEYADLERMLSRHVRQDSPNYKILISDKWPDQDDYYGDDGSCFYEPDGCNKHCPDQLLGNGGFILKVFQGDTPDEMIQYVADHGEDDAYGNEWPGVRAYAIARAVLFPTDHDDTYLFSNFYSKRSVNISPLALRDSFVKAMGWHCNPERKVVDNACYYINCGNFKAVISRTKESGCVELVGDAMWECPACNEMLNGRASEDGRWIESENRYICAACAEDYSYCESCDELHPMDRIATVADFSDGYERSLCECCIDNDSDIQSAPSWLNIDCYYIDLGR